MLGLPDQIRGCLFDLDGVITQTATLHAAAWKDMFDDFLRARAAQTGEQFVPFDADKDYHDYVDGKRREEGTESFLASRGIHLPEGTDGDPPGTPTIRGLASAKNDMVLARMHADGVEAFPGSVRYLQAVRDAGLRRAVVSSSANAADMLESAGLAGAFEARVDGLSAQREHLAGKPAPDTFLAGAAALGLEPAAAAVFEDALAGVAAGRAGQFGYVVGIDRAGQAGALREHGADVVVTDLAQLL